MSYEYGMGRQRDPWREEDDWQQWNAEAASTKEVLTQRKERQEKQQPVQPKHADSGNKIVSPDDVSEKKADEVSAKITEGKTVDLSGVSGNNSNPVSAKSENGDAPPLPDGFHEQMNQSSGQALKEGTKAEMESKTGADFSDVKVHTDSTAHQLSESINAKAFTSGQDIFFGKGHSPEDKPLLAHELVHTVQNDISDAHQIKRSIDPYVPDWAEHQAAMGKLDDAGRKKAIDDYLAIVKASWNQLDTLGLLALLDDAESEEAKMTTNPPLQGISTSKPSNYNYLFDINQYQEAGSDYDTSIAYSLLKNTPVAIDDQGTTQIYSIDELAKTAENTTKTVKSLRRLDDILKRVLIAHQTSLSTGSPIADVLAVYRQEGNLNVPPSYSEYQAGIPSGTSNALTSIGGREEALSHNAIMEAVSTADPSAAFYGIDVHGYLIGIGGMQIAGLDQMAGWMFDAAKASGNSYETEFAKWSNNNWKKSGRDTDTIADAKLRYQNIKNLTKLEKVGTPQYYRMVPIDVVGFVSAILTESMILKKRYQDVNSTLSNVPDNYSHPSFSMMIAYMQYNAGGGNFHSMLTSAATSAKSSSNPNYSELKSLLNDTKTGWKGTSFSSLQTWLLADGARLELLSEFMETAGTSDWPYWKTQRSNASRVNTLSEYYGNVFDPEKGKWLKAKQKIKELSQASANSPVDQTELDALIAKWRQENTELADISITYLKNASTWSIKLQYSTWSDENVSTIPAK